MEKIDSILARKDKSDFDYYLNHELKGELNRYIICDPKQNTQMNLLHYLAGKKSYSPPNFIETCLRTLLNKPGVDVNFTGTVESIDEITAAHIAVQWLNVPVLQILIAYDCDLLICNSEGQNVQDYAVTTKNPEIIRIVDEGISTWFTTHSDLFRDILNYPSCGKEGSPQKFRQKSQILSPIYRYNSKSSLSSYPRDHRASSTSLQTRNLSYCSINSSSHSILEAVNSQTNFSYNIPNDNNETHFADNNHEEQTTQWNNYESQSENNWTDNLERPKSFENHDNWGAIEEDDKSKSKNASHKDSSAVHLHSTTDWVNHDDHHEQATESWTCEPQTDWASVPEKSHNSYGREQSHNTDAECDWGKETQEAHETTENNVHNDADEKNDNYSYNDWGKDYSEDAKENLPNDNQNVNNNDWTKDDHDDYLNNENSSNLWSNDNNEHKNDTETIVEHYGENKSNKYESQENLLSDTQNDWGNTIQESTDYWNTGQAVCKDVTNHSWNNDEVKTQLSFECKNEHERRNSFIYHDNESRKSWNYHDDDHKDNRKFSYSHDDNNGTDFTLCPKEKSSDVAHSEKVNTSWTADTTYYHDVEEYNQDQDHHTKPKRLSEASDVKYERTPNESFDSQSTEIYTYHDQTMDVQLIEERFPGASRLIDEQHKTEQLLSQNRFKEEPDHSGQSFNHSIESVESTIDELILKMTDTQLYSHLKENGAQPGPINCQTRKVYEKKANRMMKQPTSPYSTPSKYSLVDAIRDEFDERIRRTNSEEEILCRQLANYPLEFNNLVRRKFPFEEAIKYENMLMKEFDHFECAEKDSRNTYFCYLILDPHISENLPNRANLCLEKMLTSIGSSGGSGLLEHLDPKLFASFLLSIFYVGKGNNSRSYQHFYDALKVAKVPQQSGHSPKIARILQIWGKGKGPVSLHCFQGISSDEAFTREALMIEVLSLSNLTNQISGQYKCDLQLNRRQRNILGTYLLFKAFIILLLNGERQVKMPVN